MIPRTHEALETLIQSIDLYSSSLKEWLAVDDSPNIPAVRKLPKELRQLYERRVDLCGEIRRKLHDEQVDLHLDRLYAAAGNDGEPQSPVKQPAKAGRRKAAS